MLREANELHFHEIFQGQTLAILIPFAAFAVRKNAKRELSFFLPAARVAGWSPLGLKGGKPGAFSLLTCGVFKIIRLMSINRQAIEEGVRLLLSGLGEDLQREGLVETPDRVARFYEKFFHVPDNTEGLHKTFGIEHCGRYVLLRNVPFFSLCEHHLLPFFGKAAMAYEVHSNRVLGLSKCVRILELCAHQLQLQERLTEEVADTLVKMTSSEGVMVLLEARHLCLEMRGVKAGGACYVTRALRGNFATDDGLLSDVLAMIRLGKTEH
ncbi:MAG: GTP cyclohydrolase I [Puniceicoccales bacterium]|nr:GTP cyclohydrolase I [Puniceicoccales bacterium]